MSNRDWRHEADILHKQREEFWNYSDRCCKQCNTDGSLMHADELQRGTCNLCHELNLSVRAGLTPTETLQLRDSLGIPGIRSYPIDPNAGGATPI